jgi:hypothetical protein
LDRAAGGRRQGEAAFTLGLMSAAAGDRKIVAWLPVVICIAWWWTAGRFRCCIAEKSSVSAQENNCFLERNSRIFIGFDLHALMGSMWRCHSMEIGLLVFSSDCHTDVKAADY